ncbi:uncharacterized protein LW94_9704 [Fusarium fujikuroi]|nr:uncharacterized protein LW94_9704 [Fusarium fujikuroi]SCO34591.1 uncharacterized protein FFMR_03549 [Fusarium fujikuroi]
MPHSQRYPTAGHVEHDGTINHPDQSAIKHHSLTSPEAVELKNEPDHDWVETKESEDFGIHGHNSDDEDDSQVP